MLHFVRNYVVSTFRQYRKTLPILDLIIIIAQNNAPILYKVT